MEVHGAADGRNLHIELHLTRADRLPAAGAEPGIFGDASPSTRRCITCDLTPLDEHLYPLPNVGLGHPGPLAKGVPSMREPDALAQNLCHATHQTTALDVGPDSNER